MSWGNTVILAKGGTSPEKWSLASGAFGRGYGIQRSWVLAGGSGLLWPVDLGGYRKIMLAQEVPW